MKIIMFYFSKGTLYCLWTLTRGRNAFCLLETRRFLTPGVDTKIVTRFITRNAFNRKTMVAVLYPAKNLLALGAQLLVLADRL